MNWKVIIPVITMVMVYVSMGCAKRSEDYHVVLITLDTTRNDYVDTGNGAKAFTPELRRFSRRAVVFERAFCTIPQTLPSHLSMLTSYSPHECGVPDNQHTYDGRHPMLQQVLKEKGYTTAAVTSLGTVASNTGIALGFDEFKENLNSGQVFYATAEQVTNSAIQLFRENVNAKKKSFLWVHYSDPHSPYAPPTSLGTFSIGLDGNEVVGFNPYQGAILRKKIPFSPGVHRVTFNLGPDSEYRNFEGFVLRRLTFSKNCSVVYNNIEYSTAQYNGAYVMKGPKGEVTVKCKGKQDGYMEIFQVIPLLTWKASLNAYRREVEYMDRWVGRFLRTLEKVKSREQTIVIIAGDHGEGLGERERHFGHVRYLNRQYIEVPLMIYLPGVKPRHISTPVSIAGITPTVLEYLGYERENGFETRIHLSLLEIARSGKAYDAPATVYSYGFRPSAIEDKISVIRWPYQAIFSRDNAAVVTSEIYHLGLSQSFRKWDEYSADLLMRHSRNQYLDLVKRFQYVSVVWKTKTMARLKGKMMTPTEIERLKSMGYVD